MSLAPGHRLGPYEIVAPLGAGGMGEVYRARDSRLKRDVAIKVLPADVAGDRERLARFQREAEVLASLNHPHIAHVYGFEELSGQAEAGRHRGGVLVMELVEGEDLSQRIARGPIPIDEALPIARQIAEALEAAHDAGIIHRDLKPANIKVREDGTVKVLDFGLAKALEPGSGIGDGGAVANSPTITSPAMTMRGVILGTAAYMSPEQAKGKPVDKRADIWAFGCVLFEMLTGKRTFKGDDVTDIITSVMRDAPDWQALPPMTPPAIRTLLRRCLEKDPRKRAAHISIARLEIDDASTATGELVLGPSPAAPHHSRTLAIVAIACTAVALALGWVSSRYLLTPATTTLAPPMQFSLAAGENLQFLRRNLSSFTVSPDGQFVVYAALDDKGSQDLWLHSFHDDTVRRLPNTNPGSNPFWSPDGRFIAFQADGKLRRLDVAAGTIQTICDYGGGRGTWGRDDVILLGSGNLTRVPAGGGAPEPATTLGTGERRHVRPQFLPDGKHFIFSAFNVDPVKSTLRIGELGSMETRAIGDIASGAEYIEPGYLVYAGGDSPLMARPFDASTGTFVGEATVIANKLRQQALSLGAFSTSINGTIVYDNTEVSGQTELVWVTRDGHAAGSIASIDGLHTMSLAANDRLAAVELIKSNRPGGIWLLDLARGTRTRFAFESGRADGHPVWSPDLSKILYFHGQVGAKTTLLVRSASNTGDAEPLIADDSNINTRYATDWSKDGRYVIFEEDRPQTGWDLGFIRLDGDQRPTMIVNTPSIERQGVVSPDGRYLAYTASDGNREEVFVVTFPGATRRWQISNRGGATPRWSPDGRELFFVDLQDTLMTVVVPKGDEFQPGVPRPLFLLGATPSDGATYAVGRDGRFLVARPADRGDSRTLKVIVNAAQLLNQGKR